MLPCYLLTGYPLPYRPVAHACSFPPLGKAGCRADPASLAGRLRQSALPVQQLSGAPDLRKYIGTRLRTTDALYSFPAGLPTDPTSLATLLNLLPTGASYYILRPDAAGTRTDLALAYRKPAA